MRVAVISDTHMPRGERALSARCVELLRGSDAIMHAGDLMTVGVLRELQALGPPVHAVYGNVDEAALRMELPEARVVELVGVRIGMVHDSGQRGGRLARMRKRFPDTHAVVFGHSHIPFHEQAEGFQIFNPGSPTERRRAPDHTMGLAHIEEGRLSFGLVVL